MTQKHLKAAYFTFRNTTKIPINTFGVMASYFQDKFTKILSLHKRVLKNHPKQLALQLGTPQNSQLIH